MRDGVDEGERRREKAQIFGLNKEEGNGRGKNVYQYLI